MASHSETIGLIIESAREEKRRIAEEMYESQQNVDNFSSTEECAAYNLALREFADKLNAELDG